VTWQAALAVSPGQDVYALLCLSSGKRAKAKHLFCVLYTAHPAPPATFSLYSGYRFGLGGIAAFLSIWRDMHADGRRGMVSKPPLLRLHLLFSSRAAAHLRSLRSLRGVGMKTPSSL